MGTNADGRAICMLCCLGGGRPCMLVPTDLALQRSRHIIRGFRPKTLKVRFSSVRGGRKLADVAERVAYVTRELFADNHSSYGPLAGKESPCYR
jgi:hypothetical protein